MTDFEKLNVYDLIAFQDLKYSQVGRFMGWTRGRLDRVANRKTRITFGERDKLAAALGVTYPATLNVRLSEYEPDDETDPEETTAPKRAEVS